ncbi:MAG: trypsin-like peptidase domain-containing protein [Planctomycetes bacterium]|nr:trypsin-like peptidase domain-containing protein [Planctomycetota bacterium]
MKRTVVLCLISSGLGLLVAAAYVRFWHSHAAAQVPLSRPAPADVRPAETTIEFQESRTNTDNAAQTSGARQPAQRLGGKAIPQSSDDDDLTPDEKVNIAVYEKVNRGVVNINTKGMQTGALFFIEIPSEGAGSGSVLDKQGHILTNHHVIDGAREIQVALFDGKSYLAELVGGDPATDIAVIRIKAPPASLFPVEFGDSVRLRVGQRVFAIGNPFGLERTLTTGVVSSLNRSLPSRNNRTIKSIIQIDAAINPGNSGGPLLDSHGRLIGMNTAIASKTGQSTGVGFAVPVSSIAQVVPQLLERGRVIRADAGIAKVFQTESGLLIAALTPGGPAEKAGLRGPKVTRERRQQGPFVYEFNNIDRTAADLVVAVDGKPTTTAQAFLAAVESKQPGQTVTLGIVRDGAPTDVKLRLGESAE